MYKILGLGHPRTGTSFTSKLMQMWGLDVGHEKIKNDGVVAWQMINENGPFPFMKPIKYRPDYDCLTYNVRNPYYSIPSIVYTEDTKNKSFSYRKKVLEFEETNNHIENAILSLNHYDLKVLSMNPHVIFRIEDQQYELYKTLKNTGFDINYSEYNEKVNVRKHKNFDEMIKDFDSVSDNAKNMVNEYCVRHGYTKLF